MTDRPGERRPVARLRPRAELLERRLVMATFNVNTTLDTVAVNLQTGIDAAGRVSLRSAIMAADARGGAHTINVPAGTFKLTISGAFEDAGARGDLDLKGNITIKGKGAASTIVDGNQLDRVLDILGGKVSISGLTVRNGRVSGAGGGIRNTGAVVTLSSVRVQNNLAIGDDGTDGSPGDSVTDGAQGQSGVGTGGGGIFNLAGSLSLISSVVASNQVRAGNGGRGGAAGSISGSSGVNGADGQAVTGSNGGAGGFGGEADGGGILNEATLILSGTTVSGNKALGGNGGPGGVAGVAVGGSGGSSLLDTPGKGADGRGGRGGNGGDAGGAFGGGLTNGGSVTLLGRANVFSSNTAVGGAGGAGGIGGGSGGGGGGAGVSGGQSGGNGGGGFGGTGGAGGRGGDSFGGGISNLSVLSGPGAVITNTVALTVASNSATGGRGGAGGSGGAALGGVGGDGGPIGNAAQNVGAAGRAAGGSGGNSGPGGKAQGGGLFNNAGAKVVFRQPSGSSLAITNTFAVNVVTGGASGQAGDGGSAVGQHGGDGLGDLASGAAGAGGDAAGGTGGNGSAGGEGSGGGLFNLGSVTMTGVTVNFNANQAIGGQGGRGGNGSPVFAGSGGAGTHGGRGGNATGGNAGIGGAGGNGLGGGIFHRGGAIVIRPRQGARSGSAQSKAINRITANAAIGGAGNVAGTEAGAGANIVGQGGAPDGPIGISTGGSAAVSGVAGNGIGGGAVFLARAVVQNTTITGNRASTRDANVNGKFTP